MAAIISLSLIKSETPFNIIMGFLLLSSVDSRTSDFCSKVLISLAADLVSNSTLSDLSGSWRMRVGAYDLVLKDTSRRKVAKRSVVVGAFGRNFRTMVGFESGVLAAGWSLAGWVGARRCRGEAAA